MDRNAQKPAGSPPQDRRRNHEKQTQGGGEVAVAGTQQDVERGIRDIPCALELPRGLFGMEAQVQKRLRQMKEAGVTDVWAGTLDAAALAKEAGLRVHGGFSLNLTNSAAIEWYTAFGLSDAELSFELTVHQAAALGGALPRGLIAYGRVPLMLTRNCPAANGPQGCLKCKTPPVLTDRKGVQFPIRCTGACSEVVNSVPVWMADRLNEIRNMDFLTLRFTTESMDERQRVLEAYRSGNAAPPPPGSFTRGLYYRGFQMEPAGRDRG
ncbi:U32 family peptidase [Anaeromassilibacillus senegalensis]|uniref:U32 family peptidase n=1 Tax=Anaeromassilibacillus senegalensis TaxID=1673717 RepID=UPI0018A88120|nr:U32 family peptidase [Anaeromassilibacillus senegalensis]